MSHRVTTQTNITDKDLAIQALKTAGWDFSERGESLYVSSGPMARSSINLKTGVVEGDTDWHNRGDDSLGALKRFYAEAKAVEECRIQGVTIESREVTKEGEIVLTCQAAFA